MAGFVFKLQAHSGDGSKGPIIMALCVFQVFFVAAISGLPTASVFNCNGAHESLHPHPTNCHKYYHCVWGEAVSMDCPSNLMFSVEHNFCDWENNVNCKDGIRAPPSCVALKEFQCADGKCIPSSAHCDGTPDCTGFEDEDNCAPSCVALKGFQCADGKCIPSSAHCDGTPDCTGFEDEDNCAPPTCVALTEFQCADGKCIPLSAHCDGTPDCTGFEDEDNCVP